MLVTQSPRLTIFARRADESLGFPHQHNDPFHGGGGEWVHLVRALVGADHLRRARMLI